MSTASHQRATKKSNVVGRCPECGDDVYIDILSYCCRNFHVGECRFRIFKDYLSLWGVTGEISRDEISRLLRGENVRLCNLTWPHERRRFNCFGHLSWVMQNQRWGICFTKIKNQR